eukprot:4365701-Alexandrium_andersonii.AAC.1
MVAWLCSLRLRVFWRASWVRGGLPSSSLTTEPAIAGAHQRVRDRAVFPSLVPSTGSAKRLGWDAITVISGHDQHKDRVLQMGTVRAEE